MATASTHTAPIGIDQINNTYYVWDAAGVGFNTIQAAVDYVRMYNGGPGEIIVVHGHGYGEDIPSITGGNLGITIVDQRDERNQRYYWDGTHYAPKPFDQMSGFVAHGVPFTIDADRPAGLLLGYDPQGTNGVGTGSALVKGNTGKGMPSFQIKCIPDGGAEWTYLRCDLDPSQTIKRIQCPQQLELYNLDDTTYALWLGENPDFNISKGMYVWPKPSENAIDFQGATAAGANRYNQTIRLNPKGGDVELAANGTTVAGDVIADTIDATDASFGTCLVDNSPVRTFANSGDGGGATYPPVGIGVSGGDHWEDVSIDPNTITYLDKANSGNVTALTLTANGDKSATGVTAPATGAGMMAWDIRNTGETDLINSKGAKAGGFAWLNVPAGSAVTGGNPLMTLDSGGLLNPNGGVETYGPLHSIGAGGAVWAGESNAYEGDSTFHMLRLVVGVNGQSGVSAPGAFVFRTYTPSDSAHQTLEIVHSGQDIGTSNPLLTIDRQERLTAQELIVAKNVIGSTVSPQQGLKVVWNLSNSTGETDFINSNAGAGGGFAWYNGASNAAYSSTTARSMFLDLNGGLSLPLNNAALQIGPTAGNNTTAGQPVPRLALTILGQIGLAYAGQFIFNTTAFTGGSSSGDMLDIRHRSGGPDGDSGILLSLTRDGRMTLNGAANRQQANAMTFQSAGYGYIDVTGPDPASQGNLFVRTVSSDGTSYTNALQVNGGGINVVGAVNATGAKNFVIEHPLDSTKLLTHTCIEGPEVALFYRGESVTVDGKATVTLPDYFEALTKPEGRTVQLTVRVDDEKPTFGGQIAAGQVAAGRFRVYSTDPIIRFYWEVKAVRDNIEVEVVSNKPAEATTQPHKEGSEA